MNDYKLHTKSNIEAHALIIHMVDETWVLKLKNKETLFTPVTLRHLMDHLHSICGGLHTIDVLALQNEMQEYHTDSKGIIEYINALEAVQKKSKRGTGNNPITDATLILIATNTMLKTGAHPRTTDKWEVLNVSAQTWDAWKMAYKTADMKERVWRLATDENDAHGALHHTVSPQGTTIDNLVNKDDLEDYFDNLDVAATTEEFVLEQLTATIAALKINNEGLVTKKSNLVAEVTKITRWLGRNTDSATSGTTPEKQIPKTCPHCKKEGFKNPETCLELANNASRRPTNRKISL